MTLHNLNDLRLTLGYTPTNLIVIMNDYGLSIETIAEQLLVTTRTVHRWTTGGNTMSLPQWQRLLSLYPYRAPSLASDQDEDMLVVSGLERKH